MSFLTPLAFLAGLIAIPILLLYMLRLRRREVMVSSNFLWQQVLQDKEANTPWQRLRRNLLLFLQLLILLLMVLALARPFIFVPVVSAGQTAILLDASASMNATDVEEGTRFDEAKRRALEVINSVGANQTVTVIRVGVIPEVLAPYTTDRERLRQAIENAQPGNSPADWLSAFTLAAAGGVGIEDFTMVVIGDGGIGEADNLPEISLPGEIRFLQVGTSSDNVAITALATRSLAGQPPQLFGQLTNYGATPAEVIFSLRVDDESVPLVSQRYTVPPRGELPIVSAQGLPTDFQSLQASLTVSVNSQAQDYLAIDNAAWTVSGDSGERSVLVVTEGNLFLEQVLRSLPGVEYFRGDVDQPMPSRAFDLYIFDGYLPETLPEGDMFIINPPRSTEMFTVGGETTNAANITAVPSDDRLEFVDFGNVSILKFQQVSGTAWADVLVSAAGGPLLLAGDYEGRQIAVLTFALNQSDLPLQITWPVLVSNLMEWFTPGSILTTSEAYTVGDSVLVRPPLEAENIRITKPDGTVQDLPVERSTLIYTDTSTPGLYTLDVLAGGETLRSQVFAVNLFMEQESNITPQSIQVGGQVISGEEREEQGQQEFWPTILVLALLVLLIEWYAYHRRLQMPTLMGGRRLARAVPQAR